MNEWMIRLDRSSKIKTFSEDKKKEIRLKKMLKFIFDKNKKYKYLRSSQRNIRVAPLTAFLNVIH